ncbi:NAD(P)/FAD-dependent oxidoreductase [Marivirga sp. S37H4]|uniref:NAD(P)/FAD-dependent oxidoreductase n=1 Tax=Marivirga aurantiaca TaxID=2802615 RepID=A0A934X1D4_9BACT|nr:NAD(P)/FAD-dependent oxidoreductase [Marivirga aurantiaca]MBK6266691.1 NAD(P)/FAD-dependent oxidoreductase [Marivirga aurantiaca]
MKNSQQKVIIVGGGLAGLIAAITLARNGVEATLIEKKHYPFHRVCGEYISNEVVPFLQRMDIFPEEFPLPQLKRFLLSDIEGKTAEIKLPLGGFGISRYEMDHFLYQKAKLLGVEVLCGTEVTDVLFHGEGFQVDLKKGESLQAEFVINAYGKRSKLDKTFNRNFIEKKSPFLGVKYHAFLDYPEHLIGLYNFPGGYCGVSQVEKGMLNICYLSRRENLKNHSSIPEMEKAVLYKNPHLKDILGNADFVREKPEVINEISFEKKKTVENHMLMAGDTAGLITPLCGNGMAMAIHSGFIAANTVSEYYQGNIRTREEVEGTYLKTWQRHFSQRLWYGRKTQNLFGHSFRSRLAVNFVGKFPKLASGIIRQTHGEVF